MANTNLSGDALSLAAAEAIGWENLYRDEGDTFARREGSPCEFWDDLLYGTDNRRIGEMLEWLAKSGVVKLAFEPYADSSRAWQCSWFGRGSVFHVGAEPCQAVARCVVEVAKLPGTKP